MSRFLRPNNATAEFPPGETRFGGADNGEGTIEFPERWMGRR